MSIPYYKNIDIDEYDDNLYCKHIKPIIQILKSGQYPVLLSFYEKLINFSNDDLQKQKSIWKQNKMNFYFIYKCI